MGRIVRNHREDSLAWLGFLDTIQLLSFHLAGINIIKKFTQPSVALNKTPIVEKLHRFLHFVLLDYCLRDFENYGIRVRFFCSAG